MNAMKIEEKNSCQKAEAVFSLFDKKWMGLIVDVLLQGPKRYKDIAQQIPSISDRILVQRLKELMEKGIVTRQVYTESPIRVEYHLTEKGMGLENVLAQVHQWSEKWGDL